MKKILSIIVCFTFGLCCYSQEECGMGLLTNDSLYEAQPRVAQRATRDLVYLPKSHSLLKYCPYPKSQGKYGTCTSWAAGYAARTIAEAVSNNWTDRSYITNEAFSPIFIYTQIKFIGDYDCSKGSYIEKAAQILLNKGVTKYSSFDNTCADEIPPYMMLQAINHKIDGYQSLFGMFTTPYDKIRNIKKAISEDRPVIVGMQVWNSFSLFSPMDVWSGERDLVKGNHAMCIVGYDDERYGGAFLIMNSWGMNWGNKGFIWMTYDDFVKDAHGAIEIYVKKKVLPKPKPVPQKNNLAGSFYIEEKDGKNMMALEYNTNQYFGYYKAKDSYYSGKKFRLHVNNNEPAYVYVFASDKSKKNTKLFPYASNINPYLNYKDNNIILPDESHEFEFDGNAGTDYFCVLYSTEKLNIDSIVDNVHLKEGDFYQRLYNTLKGKMIEKNEIQYERNKMAFKANSLGTIVPIIVEIPHKNISIKY